MKRIAWFTFLILSTLAVLYLLWLFKEALILFLFSLAAAATARPLVDRLTARRIPRAAGLLIVYLSTLLIIGLLLSLSSSQLVSELGDISNRFVMWYDQAWANWPTGSQIQQVIIQYLPAPNKLYAALAGAEGEAFAQTVFGITVSSLAISSQFIAVLVLSIYWSVDQARFERLWLSLLPVEQRARAREVWRNIDEGVGSYIRSELVQSLLAGVLLWFGFQMIGLPFPVLLGIFGAIAWLVPWLGALLAIAPVVWVGLLISPFTALAGIVYTIIILMLLEFVVEPRLYSRKQYSSLLTVILVIVLADSYGIFGIILAPPLAAAIQIFFRNLQRSTTLTPEFDSTREISELRARVKDTRVLAERLQDGSDPQTANMLDRLDQLIERASKNVGRGKA